MDKTERVRAALEGGTVDRAPFSLFYHFREDQAAGDAMARAHVEFSRETDPDFLKVMNDNRYAPPEFAGLKSASDWRTLHPVPISAQCFQDQLSGLKKIRGTLGKEVLVIATVFNPYHDADVISGGTLADQMKEYPEAVDEGMSTIVESIAMLVRACVEVGADGIYFAAHGGGRQKHTQRTFERSIKPHDLEVIRAALDAGATFNVLHVCGKELRLESYADYPSHAVNWAAQSGNPSLAAGKSIFKRTVMGGLDQEGAILTGRRESVEEEVVRAL